MKRAKLYFVIAAVVLPVIGCQFASCSGEPPAQIAADTTEHLWRGWNKYQIKPDDSLAKYGRELIENTSYYLGPKGIVTQITNGMNCQNCHLNGGTVPW